MMRRALVLLPMIALLGAAAPAQQEGTPIKPEQGLPLQTIHMEAALGSFKMIKGRGDVSISFTGTVLIVGLAGKEVPSGNLKLEYDKNGRKAYFGKGTIKLRGNFRAIQCFGRDIKSTWTGYGMVFVSGEFDDNLELGTLWYDNETKKDTWYTGGRTLFLPDQRYKAPVPKPRVGGG